MRTDNIERLGGSGLNLRRRVYVGGRGEAGVAIPEYLIVLGVFIGIAVVMAAAFEPLSERYYNDMKPGLDVSYPDNFIKPPTPTPSPTAVPTP